METPPLERRLVAIVAADVEGYSRLMHGDEEATMAMLSARRAVVDDLIVRHRGRIANTAGDSVLAEFVSVADAVRCAVEIQEAIERGNEIEPGARRMRFRIGLNVGDVMVKDGDIFGDGSMSLPGSKGWSGVARFVSREACMTTCSTAGA
jgi:adenylate cyclase